VNHTPEPLPPELQDFVALLRSASPPPETIAAARQATLSATKIGTPWFSPGVQLVFLASAALVVTTGSAPFFEAPMPRETQRIVEEPAAIDPIVIVPPALMTDVIVPDEARAPTVEAVPQPPRARSRRKQTLRPIAVEEEAPAPIAPSAPSAVLASALRDYAGERWASAAAAFQSVADGTSGDAPDFVMQADFFLAKCLYHLGLFHASAAAFDEITRRGAEHRYFDQSLRWLAMLADRMPDASGVIESVGRYELVELAALDTPHTREHYLHLLYLLGRARYEERRFDEAIALFARVPDDTRWSLEARFFEGVSHVREHRSRPALRAFDRVIDAVRTGRTGGHPEASRLNDLAWMSVARLYYSLSMQRETNAGELLSLAIAAWRSIEQESEYFLDSFFEETWALYIGREYARALGHVHAFEHPSLRDRANPEAFVVRAMIFFEHCQWDAVDAAISRFHERYDPLLADVEATQRMAATNEDAYRMVAAIRARRSRVPVGALPLVSSTFHDRELRRHVDQVESIDREITRARAVAFDGSIEARVSSELAVQRSFAVERAGELARERLHRVVEELDERMVQMDTVELELATARRGEIERPNQTPMGPADGGPIMAVQGDQVWPFDGEWWADELPFYMQDVQNRCGR
jgi:tetratricopeptide (TPR) repeat protein